MFERKSKTIDIDGTSIEVREITYAGIQAVQKAKAAGDDPTDVILHDTCYTTKGERLFEDVAAVGQVPASKLETLATAAMEVSGLGEAKPSKPKPSRGRGKR
ncbi:MAG: hypothetical protein AAF561_00135 [Planctomycetota bacterium]